MQIYGIFVVFTCRELANNFTLDKYRFPVNTEIKCITVYMNKKLLYKG